MVNREIAPYQPDPASTNAPSNASASFKYRTRQPVKHIFHRFRRFVRFGGIVQRIAENEGISRSQVVSPGASQYQDHSSHKGQAVHAAHMVRAKLEKGVKKLENQTELKTALGHTQNVERKYNEWNGVGGDIDRFQADRLADLHLINFEPSPAGGEASIRQERPKVERLKQAYIKALEDSKKRYPDGEIRTEIESAIEWLRDTADTAMYGSGVQGYTGGYKTAAGEED